MSFLVRNIKKLKSAKPCYGFEVLVGTTRGDLETCGWRYWPGTAHIEPPSVPTHGFYKPIIKAPATIREELLVQLRYLNVGAKDSPNETTTGRLPSGPGVQNRSNVPKEAEEPIWEEYGYTRDEWYALPDETVVAQEHLPEHCNHVVLGGRLVKRYLTP